MGGGVGVLLIRTQVLGNEAYENRNGILLYKSKRQSKNGKEFDTYKIGTVANSTSTMHKLTSKPITLDCFEIDDFNQDLEYYATNTTGMLSDLIIEQLEFLRQKYLETKDKKYWKQLVRWLPQGWLQTRTWTANYEVIRTMVHQRQNHKLNQWSGLDDSSKSNFITWAETLPYADEFIFN